MRALLWALVALGCTRTVTTQPTLMASNPRPTVRSSEMPVGYVPLELSLETPLDNGRVELQSLRGKGVVIAAISVDDVHCQALVRHLERLVREHPDDLAVVAVVGDQSDAASLRTLLETYQSVLGLRHTRLALASQEVRSGATALGSIERVPTVYVLNRAGVLVRRETGYQPYATLAEWVAPTLPH